MQFDINKFLIEHLWAIGLMVLGGYGWHIKVETRLKNHEEKDKNLEKKIEEVRCKDIEEIKKFNDERYLKLEGKIDKVADMMDELKKSVNHMTGYLMGLKDKDGQ